jgi:hypothetical protein
MALKAEWLSSFRRKKPELPPLQSLVQNQMIYTHGAFRLPVFASKSFQRQRECRAGGRRISRGSPHPYWPSLEIYRSKVWTLLWSLFRLLDNRILGRGSKTPGLFMVEAEEIEKSSAGELAGKS